MNYYLITIWDDLEPQLIGPFPSEEMRDDKAIDFRHEFGKDHGIYPLNINGPGKPTIEAYSGGFFMNRGE